MASTATEWLIENPGDVAALSEMFAELDDFTIGLWTEMPEWMKKEIAVQLQEVFEQDFWQGIAETTGKDAEQALKKGLEDGWSMRRIAKEMVESLGGDQYAKNRAMTIAKTEAGNALNGARKAASDKLKQDLPMIGIRRFWLSVLGDTTRATHADLDGVPENDDGMWELSGVKIPWPSHFKLPPGERCNCQCTTVDEFGVSDDEAQELIDLYYEGWGEQ